MLYGVNTYENFDWPYLGHYLINCKTRNIKFEVYHTRIPIVTIQRILDQKLKSLIPKNLS